jgi:hypothetical protein
MWGSGDFTPVSSLSSVLWYVCKRTCIGQEIKNSSKQGGRRKGAGAGRFWAWSALRTRMTKNRRNRESSQIGKNSQPHKVIREMPITHPVRVLSSKLAKCFFTAGGVGKLAVITAGNIASCHNSLRKWLTARSQSHKNVHTPKKNPKWKYFFLEIKKCSQEH